MTATTSANPATVAWTAADCDGIAAVTISIDGGSPVAVSRSSGSSTSAAYAYSAAVPAGKHSYTVTATDSAGVPATSTGSFTVKPNAPTISSPLLTAGLSGTTTVSWDLFDVDGLASVKLSIDGKSVSVGKTQGNDVTATYVFSGALSTGKHSFVITVVDAKKASISVRGSFTVSAASAAVASRSLEAMGPTGA